MLTVSAVCTTARGAEVVALDGYHNNETSAPGHYRWEGTDMGGYSQLAALVQALGAHVRTIGVPMEQTSLRDVDVLIMVDPDTAKESKDPKHVTDDEIDALESWVREGGRLVMFGNDRDNAEFEHWNRLAARFGLKFVESTHKNAEGKSYVFAMSPRTVLGAGLNAYIAGAAPLEISNPDAAVWLRGDTTPLMAYVQHGKGAVVALGDPWVYNEYIDSGDNRKLATNLFQALLNPATVPRRAELMYREFCANCHGRELEGGQGPSLKGTQLLHGSEEENLTKSVGVGFPDKGMPGWSNQLSAAEIRSLIIFLRERRAGAGKAPEAKAQPTGSLTSELQRFRLETVADGLETPWSMTFLSGPRILVTERPGRLRMIENGKLLPEPVKDTPATRDFGQGGLMSVVAHPDYARNGWVYLSFSDITKDKAGQDVALTSIVRGRIREGRWVDQQTIWRAPPELYLPGPNHFGNRMAFDGKGYLYFTHGDRFVKEHAQDLSRPNGKVHRLHDDGRVPADNPFVKRGNAFSSIWSYGHRNPQGLGFDPRTGVLWETEHGPRGGDELNIIRAGRNYGWPEITYGMDYDGSPISARTAAAGMEQPVTYWTPSIAICGITFYTGRAFSKWQSNLFVTSLAQQELRRLVIADGKVTHQEVLVKDIGRLRDVAQGPDGYLYLVVNSPGRIVRVSPEK